jgi:glycosyltransferase involved in cell wall biosynthesis
MAEGRPAVEAGAGSGDPRTARLEQELLTVIIPVYNEAATIDEILHKVLAAPYQKQIVVVDDGSSDQTPLILEAWKGQPQVELQRHLYNRGKGAAIRTGLDYARGRFVIIQDADLEYDPQDYPCLIEPLLRGQAQVVYGSRYLQRHPLGPHPNPPRPRGGQGGGRPISLFRFGVSVLNLCVRLIYGVRLGDEATCYKAFPTSLLRRLDLQCEGFEFCPEVTAKICRLGWKILEVPIHYDPRTVQAGKKIRWRDGWEALATLWKWRRWKPTIEAPLCARRGSPDPAGCRDRRSPPPVRGQETRAQRGKPRSARRNAERTPGRRVLSTKAD